MGATRTAFRFTSADLEGFPDLEGVRYEIIDGELYVSREAGERHQYPCGILQFALQAWSMATELGLPLFTPGLVFSDDDNVIPDLVWISYERRAAALDEKGHYSLAPELVVEVLSAGWMNVNRDRHAKLHLYSRQGVQEYWIVDWQSRAVDVYRPRGGELRLAARLRDGDDLTSPLLPGFTCPVVSLWAPPVGR